MATNYATYNPYVNTSGTGDWYTTGTSSLTDYFYIQPCTITGGTATNYYSPTQAAHQALQQAQIQAQQAQVQITPEQLQRAERERLVEAAKAEQRKQAGKLASELLLRHLTPEQKETFAKNNWFIVEGGKTKKKYRIHGDSVAGNVRSLHQDKVDASFCCHCDYSIPKDDQLLAQKLTIEYDEERFLKLANRRAA